MSSERKLVDESPSNGSTGGVTATGAAMSVSVMRFDAARAQEDPVIRAGTEEAAARLLMAMPDASRVLDCGCGQGLLGRLYKVLHPQSNWSGIDHDAVVLEAAAGHLDQVFLRDLDTSMLDDVGGGFDLIVLGNVLEYLQHPSRLLRTLHRLCAPDASLLCCIPNMCQARLMEQMLAGDLQYGPGGLDRRWRSFLSPRSCVKLLLDTGWIPHTEDAVLEQLANQPLAIGLAQAARTLGIPMLTVSENLTITQLIMRCRPSPWASDSETAQLRPLSGDRSRVSVVVPVNNEGQLCRNLLSSPGLSELDTELIICRDAANAAQAFDAGLARASAPWIIFCHQDVYFPPGFGIALERMLGNIDSQDAAQELIGFIGLGQTQEEQIHASGFLINRLNSMDHPATERALSIDELGIVVHRSTVHRLDPAFGWHLWATDLCLQAQYRHSRPARIVRLPVYHNSNYDGELPDAFLESEALLLSKYPDLDIIPSLTKIAVRM